MTPPQPIPICLSHESAVLFWRAVREGHIPLPEPITPADLPKRFTAGIRGIRVLDLSPIGLRATTDGFLASWQPHAITKTIRRSDGFLRIPAIEVRPNGLALPSNTPTPLHVMVRESPHRHRHPAIRPHLMPRDLPAGSFCQVSDTIYVTSPELSFVQTCLRDRLLPNIELLAEWCGSYALGPRGVSCTFHTGSLMTPDSLRAFIAGLGHGIEGVRAARQALAWVAAPLRSPRETEVFLILVLPPRLGGYGIARPQVNARAAAKDGGFADEELFEYEVDLLWPGKLVILEYDGEDEHESSPQKVAWDKERRSELAARGYTVIVITKRDLASREALERKIAQLARALGIKLPSFDEETHPAEAQAHQALFDWLFNPRHDHLPFGFGYA